MRDISEAASESTGRHNIEVWNDLVSVKDLLICLQISAAYAACAALLAIVVGGQPLFWGLGASVIGFTVNCFFVSPKRDVTIIDDVSDADSAVIADDSKDDLGDDQSGDPGESGKPSESGGSGESGEPSEPGEESEGGSDATASENSDDNSDKGGAE
ncbi:hypothetical protein [Actinomyces massiliensis]|uniref:hypothetical protein n=1 Tax=Actinomyces massiliensis TaxID=461393 RepID=UPI001EE64042|nr:hypothetical protein [Actinomyces massiliensis]